MSRSSKSTSFTTMAAACCLALAASACTPTIKTHGHDIDAYEINRIQPGKSSQEEVLAILGSPSATSAFDAERWYYVTQKTEEISFYQRDIITQDVVMIEFNEQNIVTNVANHGLDQAVALEPETGETKTLGNELTLMQQLLGNVGRFNGGNQGFSTQGSAARR